MTSSDLLKGVTAKGAKNGKDKKKLQTRAEPLKRIEFSKMGRSNPNLSPTSRGERPVADEEDSKDKKKKTQKKKQESSSSDSSSSAPSEKDQQQGSDSEQVDGSDHDGEVSGSESSSSDRGYVMDDF